GSEAAPPPNRCARPPPRVVARPARPPALPPALARWGARPLPFPAERRAAELAAPLPAERPPLAAARPPRRAPRRARRARRPALPRAGEPRALVISLLRRVAAGPVLSGRAAPAIRPALPPRPPLSALCSTLSD